VASTKRRNGDICGAKISQSLKIVCATNGTYRLRADALAETRRQPDNQMSNNSAEDRTAVAWKSYNFLLQQNVGGKKGACVGKKWWGSICKISRGRNSFQLDASTMLKDSRFPKEPLYFDHGSNTSSHIRLSFSTGLRVPMNSIPNLAENCWRLPVTR
jgi:hypothetical protein